MQPPLQGLPEQVDLTAHPPAEDDQLGIQHRRHRGDDQGNPFRLALHRRPGGHAAPPCGVEDLKGGEPGRHAELRRRADHALRRDRLLERAPADPVGGGARARRLLEGEVGHLAGRAAVAHVEVAVDHHSHPDPGADQEVHEGPDPDAAPEGALAEGREIGVVAHRGRLSELPAQRLQEAGAAPAADPGGEQEGPVGGVEDPGAADHGLHHLGPGDPGPGGDLAGQVARRRDHRGGAPCGVADIAAADDAPRQVGDRAADPAVADVHAHHVPRGGVVLEDQGRSPPPRAPLSRGAHQPRSLQASQRRRHGRLGEAGLQRELGARGGARVTQPLQHRALVEGPHQPRRPGRLRRGLDGRRPARDHGVSLVRSPAVQTGNRSAMARFTARSEAGSATSRPPPELRRLRRPHRRHRAGPPRRPAGPAAARAPGRG